MVNSNYDTGRINSIRQMGVFQIKSQLQEGIINSGEDLIKLAGKTVALEDDILAGIISQNFQLFSNLDGKPGLSKADFENLGYSTDNIAKITDDQKQIEASEILHNGIVKAVEQKIGHKSFLVSTEVAEADAINVLEIKGKQYAIFVEIGSNEIGQRVLKIAIQELDKSISAPEPFSRAELFIPIDFSGELLNLTSIRSMAVSQESDGFKIDVILDSQDNNKVNSVMMSSYLDSSLKFIEKTPKQEATGDKSSKRSGIEEKELMTQFTKVNSSVFGKRNIEGLVSFGNNQYLFIQISEDNPNDAIIKFTLAEESKEAIQPLISKCSPTLSKDITKGYEVGPADEDNSKIYVLLVGSNKNQQMVLVIDKDQLKTSTSEPKFELLELPWDVLQLSNQRTMSVSNGKIFFLQNYQEQESKQYKTRIISLDIDSLRKIEP